MKFTDSLTDIIKADLEVGGVPALMGEPGIGKSSFVEDLATSMSTKAFVLACNQLAEKADLTGARMVPYELNGQTKYKQEFFPHQVIQDAIDYAEANPREWPILFLDEINRSTSDVTSAALSLPTLRKIGSASLPENLRIMVAGNNKGNVTMLDEASISRFSIYNVEPDAQTLIAVLGANINPYVKNVLTKFPHLVFAKGTPSSIAVIDGGDEDEDTTVAMADLMDSGEEMLQLTTPRTIDGISRWLNVVDQAKLTEYLQTPVNNDGRDITLLDEIIEAHVGNTDFATHLVAEITAAINAGAHVQAQTLTAPKPNCFASLKDAKTVTELEKLINGLTDHEKSGSLLYAMFERADNKVLIEQLAQQTTGLETDHNKLLVQLATSAQLDESNVAALLGTTTPAAARIKPIIDAVMA